MGWVWCRSGFVAGSGAAGGMGAEEENSSRPDAVRFIVRIRVVAQRVAICSYLTHKDARHAKDTRKQMC